MLQHLIGVVLIEVEELWRPHDKAFRVSSERTIREQSVAFGLDVLGLISRQETGHPARGQ